MMAKHTLTPREARTERQTRSLPCDASDTKGHWVLVDVGTVHIVAQRNGEDPTERITIPRRAFEHFIDWYNGVQPRRRKS